eukprot:TRINITY_DN262_c0_g1_i11.p1 TRINITY_DN262_c0_g1~~TRINITY_DN262_c0_g1_i11.p1  ORF type:complete len:1235 (+),score=274.30 TRINITY_DN262_c0_g1_i11:26-3730(+)
MKGMMELIQGFDEGNDGTDSGIDTLTHSTPIQPHMTHLTTPRIIVVIITLTTLTLITPTTTSTLQPQSHKSLHNVPFHNMLYDHTTAQFHPLSPSHERHLRFLDTTITLDTDSHTNQTALINHFNRIHNDHKHRLFDKHLQRFFTFKPPLTKLHIDQIVADLSVQSPRHLHWVSPATLLVTLTRDHPLTQQSERPIDDLITRWSDSLPLISHFFPTEKLKLHPFLGQFLHAFPEDNTATVAPSNLHHHLQFDSQTSPAATKHIRTRNNEMLMEYIVNSADESPRPRMNKFVGLGHPDSSISLYIIPTAHATRQMYQLNSLVDHLLHHTRSIMTQDGHDHDANAVKLVVASPNKLLLTLSCSHIKHAVNPKPLFDSFKKIVLMLALHPDVHFIEPQLQMAKLNKFAHWVTQSNRNNDSPFWDAGLQGQGQIVGCADTGIDYDSCYFIDHNVALPVNRIDMNHRKIVSYTTEFADQNDYESGHGTHVVGSIAGDAINGSATAQSFNGMAPKAKLAFTDICVNQCQTGLNVPSDMSTKLFPTHYNAGARIDSNSWGSNLNSYTSSAREVDEYTYANQDYLVLIAAGNTGPNYFTVSSPATSKNCIAVGASFNALESFTKNGLRGILISSPPSVHGTYLVQYNGFTSSPDNVDTIQLSSVRGIFYTDNALGCNNWSTDQKTVISSRVLFVRRGQCFFTDKVRIGLEAGAVAVVVVNDRDGAPIPMGGDGTGLSIPSVMMDKQEGEQIISALGSGPSTTDLRVDLGPQVIAPPSKYYSTDNMASFSSRGPTQDARLKPDLVAPGYRISSAKSDGNQASPTCSDDPLTIMGTSMATPVSAGTLALIRQYFAEGFYPSGKRNPADAKVISGVLLKAVALTATRSMISGQAGTSNGRHLSETPSYDQGYGRLELEAALPLNGSTTQNPNLRLVVVDTEEQSTPTQVSSGEIDKYYLTAGGDNIPLVVTLTWFDPPASLFSGMNLINNLDLHVVMPNGSYIVGNHKASSAVGVACKMTTDSLNNVERVIIDNPPSGYPSILPIHYFPHSFVSFSPLPSFLSISEHMLCPCMEPTYPLVLNDTPWPCLETLSKERETTAIAQTHVLETAIAFRGCANAIHCSMVSTAVPLLQPFSMTPLQVVCSAVTIGHTLHSTMTAKRQETFLSHSKLSKEIPICTFAKTPFPPNQPADGKTSFATSLASADAFQDSHQSREFVHLKWEDTSSAFTVTHQTSTKRNSRCLGQ